MANDLAVSPDGTVYVTDTAKHEVIQLSPDGKQSGLTGEAQFGGANGIALAENSLYVCCHQVQPRLIIEHVSKAIRV